MFLDEKQHAEEILKNNKINEDHDTYDLAVIAKYLVNDGYDYKKTRNFLEDFCLKNIKYFNIVVDYWKIDYAIKIAQHYKLRVPVEVIITQAEISYIQTVENKEYEKLLLLALFIAKQQKYDNVKIKKRRSSSPIGLYCNVSYKNLIKMAGLNWNIDKSNKISHYLYLNNFIDITSFDWVEIKYASERGYPAFSTLEFEDTWMKYLRLNGERIETCSTCGKLYLKKTSLQTMCRSCYSEYRNKVKLMSKKRIRMATGLN